MASTNKVVLIKIKRQLSSDVNPQYINIQHIASNSCIPDEITTIKRSKRTHNQDDQSRIDADQLVSLFDSISLTQNTLPIAPTIDQDDPFDGPQGVVPREGFAPLKHRESSHQSSTMPTIPQKHIASASGYISSKEPPQSMLESKFAIDHQIQSFRESCQAQLQKNTQFTRIASVSSKEIDGSSNFQKWYLRQMDETTASDDHSIPTIQDHDGDVDIALFEMETIGQAKDSISAAHNRLKPPQNDQNRQQLHKAQHTDQPNNAQPSVWSYLQSSATPLPKIEDVDYVPKTQEINNPTMLPSSNAIPGLKPPPKRRGKASSSAGQQVAAQKTRQAVSQAIVSHISSQIGLGLASDETLEYIAQRKHQAAIENQQQLEQPQQQQQQQQPTTTTEMGENQPNPHLEQYEQEEGDNDVYDIYILNTSSLPTNEPLPTTLATSSGDDQPQQQQSSSIQHTNSIPVIPKTQVNHIISAMQLDEILARDATKFLRSKKTREDGDDDDYDDDEQYRKRDDNNNDDFISDSFTDSDFVTQFSRMALSSQTLQRLIESGHNSWDDAYCEYVEDGNDDDDRGYNDNSDVDYPDDDDESDSDCLSQEEHRRFYRGNNDDDDDDDNDDDDDDYDYDRQDDTFRRQDPELFAFVSQLQYQAQATLGGVHGDQPMPLSHHHDEMDNTYNDEYDDDDDPYGGSNPFRQFSRGLAVYHEDNDEY